MVTSLPEIGTLAYFETIYERDDDPFGLDHRWYELRKRAMTLAVLPRARYRRTFEPGCSNGALTVALAGRSSELVAADVSPRAVALARDRTASLKNVSVIEARVPEQWPPGAFDLVVVSEVAYYLSPRSLERLVNRVVGSLEDGGHLLAVHWRHPIADCAMHGDEVHDAFHRSPHLRSLGRYVEPQFLIEAFGSGGADLPRPHDSASAPAEPPAPG